MAVLGYFNEKYVTLDIVTESTYTFLKTLSSDYPIGNFIKLPNIKLIISKGIRTKYSSPTIWNINSETIQPMYFPRPYNDLIGCTGIGYLYFSSTSTYYILTMWRHPEYF